MDNGGDWGKFLFLILKVEIFMNENENRVTRIGHTRGFLIYFSNLFIFNFFKLFVIFLYFVINSLKMSKILETVMHRLQNCSQLRNYNRNL